MSTRSVDEKVLGSLVPRKTFNFHQGASITSLDFDDSGHYLISAGVDKSIQVYDVHKGVHFKDVQSQKYGAHLAKFTHDGLNCLYVTTPTADQDSGDVDHSIRYLSLSDKRYLRYFKGHKLQVVSLDVDPVHDMFISSSMDGTVKVWDLKTSSPMGSLDIGLPSLVAYDPHGIIFVVAKGPRDMDSGGVGELQLYDIKTFHKSPFLTVPVTSNNPEAVWTKVEFANNGKTILLATNCHEHYVFDAFLGQLLTTLSIASASSNGGGDVFRSKYPLTSTCCYSPCGKYVLVGSPNSSLLLYDLTNIKTTDGINPVKPVDNPKKLLPVKTIATNQGVPKILAFNPKLLTIATADNSVSLWQPLS